MADPSVVAVGAVTTAVVRATVPTAELAPFFDRAFTELGQVLAAQDVAITGPAFARYAGPPTDTAELEVGFPTAAPVRPEGDVEVGTLPAGRVARVEHHGGYDGLGATWEGLAGWIEASGLRASPVLWEVYVTQPSPEMDPADLVTELSWLLDASTEGESASGVAPPP